MSTSRSWLPLAFPTALRAEAAEVVQLLPEARWAPTEVFLVVVDGEDVAIPRRVYNPEPTPEMVEALLPVQQTMLACLYTRHHDGYVRQRQLRRIATEPHLWVVPFVVQLVGEYVVQIVLDVRDHLVGVKVPGSSLRAAYGRFAADNPRFLDLTFQRATSYWDCYYRDLYATRRHYPAFEILSLLRDAGRDATTAG